MIVEILLILIAFVALLVAIDVILNSRPKSLKNKHVVITGGSSGIGKGVAIQAVNRGAHVTILARDKVKLKAAEQEIINACKEPLSQQVQSISLDVTNDEEVDRILKKLDKELPVFMLVNCAGMAICGKLEDMPVSDIKTLIDLNLLGTVYPVRALVAAMKQRKEGIIVMTASGAAMLGIFGFTLYSATKYAMRGFAEALHMEVKPYNISVTVSFPPDTDTPGFENENKSKPIETKLISESGGLYDPDYVADKIISDALVGKFYSTVGFEGFMLSIINCGMTPFRTFFEVFIQMLLVGPFRLISTFYLLRFQRIVKQCKEKQD
ncbi:uncharacterized protein CBL_06936 [Carabus blaptoides fortunei]